MRVRWHHRVVSIVAATVAAAAHAAHPLISEDTATQGRGKLELELGAAITRDQGGRIIELDPQLSYGALDDLDLILRPSVLWLTGDAADAVGRRRGFGATALDVKWRPLEWSAWSVGTRAGVDLPTASDGVAPRQPGTHALVMATYGSDAVMATANVAYVHAPRDATAPTRRRDIVRLSAGTLVTVRSGLRLAADIAAMRATDATDRGWPAVAVLGAIISLPGGPDVDAGYQLPLNARAPSGAWLVGATLRW
jgi:hypothetical protein